MLNPECRGCLDVDRLREGDRARNRRPGPDNDYPGSANSPISISTMEFSKLLPEFFSEV